MRPPAAAVSATGQGPNLVLVHGTATDRSGWGTLPWLLRDRARIVRYDRRGTGLWPLATDAVAPTVADHAGDLADLVVSLPDAPTFVCGASFGATVALELARSRPGLVAGAVLFEPAIINGDDAATPDLPVAREIRSLGAAGREWEAVERFLGRVMPRSAAEAGDARARRAMDWQTVWRDLAASADYRPRLASLRSLRTPVLLLHGERSPEAMHRSVDALAAVLPRARAEIVAGADHALAGEGVLVDLAGRITSFIDEVATG